MTMKNILTGLILAYQKTLSPWLGPHCRFYPNCSEFSRQAIEKYGVITGVGLALGRLFRCHPFCSGGYDPLKETYG